MKKSSFVALVMGTVSGLLFSLGMCMALLPQWDAFTEGVILGVVGALLALVTVFVYRRMEHMPKIKLSGKAIVTAIVAVVGALTLGLGMCLCLVWESMVVGILVGIVGIVVLLCLIPLTVGLK